MNKIENKPTRTDGKEYEMAYLLTSDIPEDKIDSETADLKKIITENGGDVIQADSPEKRRLAYPVKKQTQAYFGIVYFNIGKENLDKVKKTLALYKKVIRYLILTKVVKPTPSPITIKQPAETPAPMQSFDQKLESILKR